MNVIGEGADTQERSDGRTDVQKDVRTDGREPRCISSAVVGAYKKKLIKLKEMV